MGIIKLENIKKSYGQTLACSNINLNINEGEFFTFLGPSGCGKTTLLRLIAGFIQPDCGSIYIGSQNVTQLPTEKRSVGMVFQNYALFPFMTVYENVEYSLKIRRMNKKASKERVKTYLDMVELGEYGQRNISELSGGEQQRVALARSLAMEPKVLLLDEPLSNLDARLRASMRVEISRIIKNLGITTLFVTHDQTEALTMSDRIAVFEKGHCLQVGTPENIYNVPSNSFVAQFVGDTNLISADTVQKNPELARLLQVNTASLNSDQKLSVRPQNIRLHPIQKSDSSEMLGVVQDVYFTGGHKEYLIRYADHNFKVSQPNTIAFGTSFSPGDNVQLDISQNAITILKT